MKENISPEEKLLRLIRGQKKNANKGFNVPSNLNPEIKQKIGNSTVFVFQKYFSSLSFFDIHKIIFIAFILSSFYFIVAFVYPKVFVHNIQLPTLALEEVNEEKMNPKVAVKPSGDFLESLKNRQIFSSENPTETRRIVASGVNAEIVKDITLLGIVLGESPQAVIEDKKMEKTYYVTKGQFINELQVEDIQEGKIILNYNGQKLELYL